MLAGIRAAQSTLLGKLATALIFGVILVAFVIWGIGDVFRGIGTNQVAQVGGVSISTLAYRQAYQTELSRLQQRARRPITNEEAHAVGVDRQVLTRLMSEAVLDDEAQRMGLAFSDRQVATSILADPSFAGPGGSFDRARFEGILRANNYTEQTFIREQRSIYLRQELIGALAGNLVVPTAALDALHRFEDETRSLDAVVLTTAAAGDIPAPEDAALQAYYDAHKNAFSAPQYRKLVVLTLSAKTLARPDAVSEADAIALYDQVKAARFAQPERRVIQQLAMPTDADAAAFSAKLTSGMTFTDAVKDASMGDKVVDLGSVARDAIYDHAVADAAFALPADGTSAPLKTSFGPVIVHVGTIEPASTASFGEVAPALKAEIADREAGREVDGLRQKIEDARSSGKSLAEAAATAGLEVRTVDAVDASGRDKAGQKLADLPDEADLLKAAFASDVGVDNDTIATPEGGFVWYEVAGVEPARQLSLAEAKPQVEAAWRANEAGTRLAAKTSDLVKDIDAGRQTLDQVASSLGLTVQHVADAKRSGATGLPNAIVPKIFDTPVGGAGSAPEGAGSRILYKVLDSIVSPLDADAPATKTIADRYRVALEDDILNAYLAEVAARIGTKVNAEAVRAASGAGY